MPSLECNPPFKERRCVTHTIIRTLRRRHHRSRKDSPVCLTGLPQPGYEIMLPSSCGSSSPPRSHALPNTLVYTQPSSKDGEALLAGVGVG
ncbi:hypothetical protein FJTKL_07301 [Diaporthe vaccinii]|uniref:Uncharacterized protein n=1 Tax=Diaporthe vaccinii TaxID=105482 RepID=A0ABR4EUF1_9PEZI